MPRDLRPLLKKLLANPDSERAKSEARAALKPKRGRPLKIDRAEVQRLIDSGVSAAEIERRGVCSADLVRKIQRGER